MLETAIDNIARMLPLVIVGYGLYVIGCGATKIAVKHPKETMTGVRIIKAMLRK